MLAGHAVTEAEMMTMMMMMRNAWTCGFNIYALKSNHWRQIPRGIFSTAASDQNVKSKRKTVEPKGDKMRSP